MSSYHFDAITKEFPWIKSVLRQFCTEYPTFKDGKVLRADLKLADQQRKTNRCGEANDRYFICTSSGEMLHEVGIFGRRGLIATVLSFGNSLITFNQTVANAIEFCSRNYTGRDLAYVLRVQFSSEESTLTLYKSPKGYNLAEWIEHERQKAKADVEQAIAAVDNIEVA